ncbi:30S ribosomal protein S4 [Candidatus Halobonum tyrrellensis]|uniref:Small ribosomal subunit protein uS4 n=1 Tax=Candidatus Halobonum tyrrellensis G22 TaxID=1324957 RepID=V4GWD8_9EURY|nr:30S ribosomal protein S4 [Candidatus Halobonum tyrrellensis]ESP89471.1 30S ribosomal protein S4P [Candidatus Halobonum tyrrellensis G22]
MATGNSTKRYETPNHPYQGERIAQESDLLGRYGLSNKEELWRAQSELRDYRREARSLIGDAQGDLDAANEAGSEFVARLQKNGILGDNDALSDVLSLDVTDVLERRLQTVAYRKGVGNTPKQARQFIVHGHVVVGDARVTRPSYTVETAEADLVDFDEGSPLADDLHPERAEGQ